MTYDERDAIRARCEAAVKALIPFYVSHAAFRGAIDEVLPVLKHDVPALLDEVDELDRQARFARDAP